ncbi:glutamine ABC transporter substrate-binding protein [Cohnella kolymensis]|uniref:Glutamine ABC transporter substrate-binding protein n=1 Tax=Cohnella kolymensis TaxID=1590652 RepID=A0ABR5A9P9_9BACL|nr:basic amino acid ABC transporter substrate-binding protein [Cohnella kolymensis]KIL37568.1 glutamine ABC transporter substrate-binding protein [Cohnella kolymensis]
MKKGLWFALCAVLTVSLLAGCGASNEGSGDKTYLFATDAQYAPMEFMDKDKITGFDADFLEAVMKEAGLKYELKNVGWDTLLVSLEKGIDYDAAISSVTISDDRLKTNDFSRPYFESTNMILTKEGSPIKSALDLKDKKVGVQGLTTADILMMELTSKDNANIKKFDSNAVAIMELEQGGVDAVVADMAVVTEYVRNNPDKKFVSIIDVENFGSEYYGIMLPKGSELKVKLDPAIKTVLENGTYAELYKKWFNKDADTAKLLEQQ